MPNPNLSRLTIDLDSKAAALLAAEGLYRKQLAARFTITCTTEDKPPSKVAYKQIAEAISARVSAAALPFFISPSELAADLATLGFTEAVAADAVGQVVVAFGLKEKAEQITDLYAADELTAHLVRVPHLARTNIRPTHEPAAVERKPEPAGPLRFEMPPPDENGRTSQAAIDRARRIFDAQEILRSSADRDARAAAERTLHELAAQPPRHENPVAEDGYPDLDAARAAEEDLS